MLARHSFEGEDRVNVAKKTDDEISMAEFVAVQRSFASVIEPALPVGREPYLVGYALPEIAGGEAPWVLPLWWCLLIGLSSLPRYEPDLWTEALDLDRSELAVPLERLLDVAQQRVPQRLLAALRDA